MSLIIARLFIYFVKRFVSFLPIYFYDKSNVIKASGIIATNPGVEVRYRRLAGIWDILARDARKPGG